jgi:hypothetical protein
VSRLVSPRSPRTPPAAAAERRRAVVVVQSTVLRGGVNCVSRLVSPRSPRTPPAAAAERRRAAAAACPRARTSPTRALTFKSIPKTYIYKSGVSLNASGGNTKKVRIVTGFRVGDRSRGRYALPADFPLHDGTPYRGLHVQRWGLGVVHRSRAGFCRAVPNPNATIRSFCIAESPRSRSAALLGRPRPAAARSPGRPHTQCNSTAASIRVTMRVA